MLMMMMTMMMIIIIIITNVTTTVVFKFDIRLVFNVSKKKIKKVPAIVFSLFIWLL
jgi:hypothetical protein